MRKIKYYYRQEFGDIPTPVSFKIHHKEDLNHIHENNDHSLYNVSRGWENLETEGIPHKDALMLVNYFNLMNPEAKYWI